MRSDASPGAGTEDLTAKARIRDAAIRCFARHGFRASLRSIAAEAQVSPGLIIHHFGSKAGLRRECDEYITGFIRDTKRGDLAEATGPMTFLSQLGRLEEFAPFMAYAVRSLQAGGDVARAFVTRIADDARSYMAEGVRNGTIVPSRDDDARARYLVGVALGPLLLDLALDPPRAGDDLATIVDRHVAKITLPALELFTEGFMTDRTLLDTYLDYTAANRSRTTGTSPPTQTAAAPTGASPPAATSPPASATTPDARDHPTAASPSNPRKEDS